jgi:ATP/maltotriose-dependent transcriptional regulator MalT
MIIEVSHQESNQVPEQIMTNLNHVKVSPCEQQVLSLLVRGCSNKEIASQINISHLTVKEHMRMLFLRAGIPTKSRCRKGWKAGGNCDAGQETSLTGVL